MNNIELLVGGAPLEEITVSKRKDAMAAWETLLKRAKAIGEVNDVKSQAKASLVAQEIQGARKGIEANYRAAKAPLLAATRALDTLYHELDTPLDTELRQIDKKVSAFQDEQRRQLEMAEARRRAEERRIEEERLRRIKELEREKEEARIKLKLAEDARERLAAQRQVAKAEEKIQTEQVSLQVERENLPVTDIPERIIKPSGSRPWTEYLVEMTDPIKLYNAQPQLLKIELRLGPAKEFAKSLDEAGKPLDSVPGLQIRKTTRTSFTGASSIRIHGEE
jgi:hypothetical protein